jgi:hypothetical protein
LVFDFIVLRKYFENSGVNKIVSNKLNLSTMRFKAALFYNNSIAFYSVYLLDGNTYKAKLDEYSGQTQPPNLVELQRNGMLWQSDCEDQQLLTELTAAIEFKKFD